MSCNKSESWFGFIWVSIWVIFTKKATKYNVVERERVDCRASSRQILQAWGCQLGSDTNSRRQYLIRLNNELSFHKNLHLTFRLSPSSEMCAQFPQRPKWPLQIARFVKPTSSKPKEFVLIMTNEKRSSRSFHSRSWNQPVFDILAWKIMSWSSR